MQFILTWLGGLLGGPFAKAAVDAYGKKLDSDNSAQKTAAGLASKEIALQQREAELQTSVKIAQIGKWYTVENLFGYVTLFYYTKIIVWDKVLELGSTDPLKGTVAEWAGVIMCFYFGKRGIENVVRIWKIKN
jgi:hypothetical protein